jgi:hypothetical protein
MEEQAILKAVKQVKLHSQEDTAEGFGGKDQDCFNYVVFKQGDKFYATVTSVETDIFGRASHKSDPQQALRSAAEDLLRQITLATPQFAPVLIIPVSPEVFVILLVGGLVYDWMNGKWRSDHGHKYIDFGGQIREVKWDYMGHGDWSDIWLYDGHVIDVQSKIRGACKDQKGKKGALNQATNDLKERLLNAGILKPSSTP